MNERLGAVRALGAGFAIATACAAATAGAQIPPEQVSTRSLPPAGNARLYVTDVAINHIVDGKILIVDASKSAYLGTVSTAMAGQTTLAPDRSEIYVATTYFTKLNRGERQDQVDVYDAATLALKAEITIPPKHAQALPYRGTLRTSSDGPRTRRSGPAGPIVRFDQGVLTRPWPALHASLASTRSQSPSAARS